MISEWCLTSAMRVLTIEHILALMGAALVEQRIIVVCSNIGTLTSIVLAMIPIIRPYAWQGPLIPILPSSLHEYLQGNFIFVEHFDKILLINFCSTDTLHMRSFEAADGYRCTG